MVSKGLYYAFLIQEYFGVFKNFETRSVSLLHPSSHATPLIEKFEKSKFFAIEVPCGLALKQIMFVDRFAIY